MMGLQYKNSFPLFLTGKINYIIPDRLFEIHYQEQYIDKYEYDPESRQYVFIIKVYYAKPIEYLYWVVYENNISHSILPSDIDDAYSWFDPDVPNFKFNYFPYKNG